MPTSRLAKLFFDYEYLREFEAKSGTARKVVYWIYEEPISTKTPEILPHCHVPLTLKDSYKMGHGKNLLEISASHTLMNIYRMTPLFAWSISMDSAFKSIV